MRSIFAAAVCAAPALAQLPAPLEAALSVTPREASPAGLDFRIEEDGQGVTVRVDLSGDGVAYTLLEPDEAALSEAQREMWDDFLDTEDDAFYDENDEDAGEGLTGPVDLRATVGDVAAFLREEEGLLVYGFEPQAMPGQQAGEAPGSMLTHLRGEIAVDPERGEVAWTHVFAPESFKPNMAARIERFSLRQAFVHEPAYAAPRLRRLEMALSGSAAFQNFEQALVMEISNMVFGADEAQSGDLGAGAESP